MVRSLAARRANQAVRRAANAAAATAMVRGASSSPPTSPAHPPALPRPHQKGRRCGNDGGEEHLLTPTVDRTVAIFRLACGRTGLPTTAPSATTTAAAATTTVSNDDVNESLELDVVPNHFVCPITKLRSRWLRVNCRRHSNSQCTPQIFVACAGWGVEVCRCPICL
jgi:hypothetical protein